MKRVDGRGLLGALVAHGQEADLRSLNLGLHTAWRRAHERDGWLYVVERATIRRGECHR